MISHESNVQAHYTFLSASAHSLSGTKRGLGQLISVND
jgi:hypothetical protein